MATEVNASVLRLSRKLMLLEELVAKRQEGGSIFQRKRAYDVPVRTPTLHSSGKACERRDLRIAPVAFLAQHRGNVLHLHANRGQRSLRKLLNRVLGEVSSAMHCDVCAERHFIEGEQISRQDGPLRCLSCCQGAALRPSPNRHSFCAPDRMHPVNKPAHSAICDKTSSRLREQSALNAHEVTWRRGRKAEHRRIPPTGRGSTSEALPPIRPRPLVTLGMRANEQLLALNFAFPLRQLCVLRSSAVNELGCLHPAASRRWPSSA